ncbi:MAG: SET domain-containing protein-lysine N-methyltransferase [Chloroflexota bacterium]|nr:SET domain-containing protein-lysine N-methyltransferase [Chloroflexota bacterium]
MTPQGAYRARSWLDPRIEVRPSPIEGLGLFATAPIREGKVVIVWGGRVLSNEEFAHAAKQAIARGERFSGAAIGENLNILQDAADPLRYGNHSCDPNLWMLDDVTECARRVIAQGEELTVDYALSTVDPKWRMECRCGMPLCRGIVTGNDWQLPELQARYRGHFSPFIEARIAALNRLSP